MEKRIEELEKKVQELEAALIESNRNATKTVEFISANFGRELDRLIHDYENRFKEITLELIAEAKSEKTLRPSAESGKDVSEGKYQLFIRNEPAAVSDSIKELMRYYSGSKSREIFKIVDRATGNTIITNSWMFPK